MQQASNLLKQKIVTKNVRLKILTGKSQKQANFFKKKAASVLRQPLFLVAVVNIMAVLQQN
jgi:hypothetical protein